MPTNPETAMHKLIGKTITAVYLAEDKKAVRFDCSDGEQFKARTDGDCCSETWIEDIDNPDALLGTVREADDINMPNGSKRTEDGEIQFYGFHVRTENGDCTIDYRNESNGYYGGNLSWDEEDFYGGVYGQNVSKEVWRQIA